MISVVIPAFNAEKYLAEAVESVLAQGHPELEVVVVDDGSTDLTATLADRLLAVRLVRRPHRGQAAARNAGVAQCHGELLAFLDADDLWTEGKLRCQLAALTEHPEADLALGYVASFVSPELDPSLRNRIACPEQPVPGYCAGAMLVRRSAFLRAGPFDETLAVGEFVDWYSRAKAAGLASLMAPDVVLRRRLHAANLSRRNAEDRRTFVRIVKAHLDRRRQRREET